MPHSHYNPGLFGGFFYIEPFLSRGTSVQKFNHFYIEVVNLWQTRSTYNFKNGKIMDNFLSLVENAVWVTHCENIFIKLTISNKITLLMLTYFHVIIVRMFKDSY